MQLQRTKDDHQKGSGHDHLLDYHWFLGESRLRPRTDPAATKTERLLTVLRVHQPTVLCEAWRDCVHSGGNFQLHGIGPDS